MVEAHSDLGFTFKASGQDVVRILRHGREVTILRGMVAHQFLSKAAVASEEAVQKLCAKFTGNYKRGNEGEARKVRSANGRHR
jgi:hypothetical protein